MCNKRKKGPNRIPPTLHLLGSLFSSWVCQLCQFVSYMKLTFMRVIVIVVVIAIVVNAPGQELPPYLHSLSLRSLFSALHSPLADWHWESVSITWPNNNLMQHWLFSLPIFNFPFYSFIQLLFFFFAFAFAVRLSVCPVRNCFRLPALSAGHFGSFLATVHSARLIVIAIFAIYGTFCSSIYRRRLSLPPSPAHALVWLFYWQLPGRLHLGLPQWTTEQWRSGTFD